MLVAQLDSWNGYCPIEVSCMFSDLRFDMVPKRLITLVGSGSDKVKKEDAVGLISLLGFLLLHATK